MIIAIDGLAASGKGTIARMLARHLDYAHLDTGLLYRAVGMAVIDAGGNPADPAAALQAARTLDAEVVRDNPALRSDQAGNAASQVAAMPEVRAALLGFQRKFCENPPYGKQGAVLDGRDIGTVIAPGAAVKLFITASPEIRAARRAKELRARGETVTDAEVLAAMQARDARDQSRGIAPAIPASDAQVLDTGSLSIDEAFALALTITGDAVKMGSR